MPFFANYHVCYNDQYNMLPRQKKSLITILVLFIIVLLGGTSIKNLPPELQILFSPTPSKIITKEQPTITQPLPLPSFSSVATTTAVFETGLIKVVRIVDGDTIVLEGGMKLRYIGINAPESVDPRRAIQCFGKEASSRNTELVNGKMVRLEKDVSETDRYGRLLRYVYVGDTMINEQLVKDGYALASAYPPDIKHQPRLKAAEEEAKRNKKGLWSACPE
jgi:micrococcal nuclease